MQQKASNRLIDLCEEEDVEVPFLHSLPSLSPPFHSLHLLSLHLLSPHVSFYSLPHALLCYPLCPQVRIETVRGLPTFCREVPTETFRLVDVSLQMINISGMFISAKAFLSLTSLHLVMFPPFFSSFQCSYPYPPLALAFALTLTPIFTLTLRRLFLLLLVFFSSFPSISSFFSSPPLLRLVG